MKKKALLIVIVLFTLLALLSCELFLEKPPKPTIHALVIGLDYKNNFEFDDPSEPYPDDDLNGTINDAKEIAAALYRRGEEMGTEVKVTFMLQEGTTPLPDTVAQAEADYPLYPIIENIETQLQRINNEMTDNDILLVYYAGHGYGGPTTPEQYQGALALAETKEAIGEPVKVEVLQATLATIKGTKLLIMDSCYSGAHETEYPTSPPDDDNASVHLVYDPSQFYLLASAPDELSWELAGAETHGYFTGQVLENLGWEHEDSTEIEVYDPDTGTRTETIVGNIAAGSEAPIERNGTIFLGDLFANIPIHTASDGGTRVNQTPQTGNGPLDLVLFSEHW
ncbi:caspase family protein [Pleomorphochaeta sp. DL1XJH-081]|uniref:caspase family protein n=1 Tax=Pleomorphochaeta sp. DL1XJH-081 TaxID=3409690 RepID=UPI003BB7FE30